MTPQMRQAVEEALSRLSAAAAARAGPALAAASAAPEDPRSEDQRREESEVAEELAAVVARLEAQHWEEDAWAAGAVGDREGEGEGAKERACRAAAAGALRDAAERVEGERRAAAAAAVAAEAEAAAKRKVKRPWPKKVGPFDHTPKRPQAGAILGYFEAEEGLLALASDPLLQGQPASGAAAAAAAAVVARAPRPVQPASPGRQYLPGVYLAASTQLLDDSTIASPHWQHQQQQQQGEGGAPAEPNLPYLCREGATMRTTNTSSAVLIKCAGRGGRQLGLSPAHVHFGAVPAGGASRRAVRLMNLGADVARVTVERPRPPLRLLYTPAPIAPGMAMTLTLELAPDAPGDYVGEVTIKGELEVAVLTVSAKVQPVAPGPGGAAAQAARGEGSDGEHEAEGDGDAGGGGGGRP
ncbi:flagellar central pair-associated protein [Monoraphidium neglectum]|uniref:Flagellar central pair-associated protein n=1 Tax=Monoraphidium neglectum TaxID=145388 RepID=A0A0D2KEF1_9CHLO|nr:flagellar central pair-associated protein [Monoraphidium neglectum]KIY94158.1 flagellar central pair-associated protein [Monoraphidium neglectum]|eukprot:XP_013893178.1 flagellar central pair-associated protein [Monoraphidium neglectum]